MAFRIDPTLVKFNAAGTAQFEGDAKSARDLLQGLAVSLKSGSGVKSGYLSLAPASSGAGRVNSQSMNDRYRAKIEAAIALLQTSATILAEGPSQA